MASLDKLVAERMQIPLLALQEFPENIVDLWRKDTLEVLGQEIATEYQRQFGNKESKS